MSAYALGTIYAKDVDGSPVIPPSQRPDGTWRKQRRVKEGYVPQEEVPLYESKGKQFAKNKPQYPVGMTAPPVATTNTPTVNLPVTKRCPVPGLVIDEDYMKKIKHKKKATAAANTTTTNSIDKTATKLSRMVIKEQSTPTPAPAPAPSSDPAKRLKNLRKKLREIETVEQKIKNGDIKNPEKEQLEKVSRKNDITAEIQKLEKQLSK